MAARAECSGVLEQFVGRTADNLTCKERLELQGAWVAVEFYSPVTLALRVYQAVGHSAADCRRQLAARGLDPANYEYFPLVRPW